MMQEAKSEFSWRLLWLIVAVGFVGVLGSLPFLMSLVEIAMPESSEPLPLPMPVILLLGLIQQFFLLVILTGCGLWAAKKVGLTAPLFEKWLSGESIKSQLGAILKISVVTGAITGIVVSLIQLFVFKPFLPELPIVAAARLPIWIRLGASFGGIVEEIVMRLFLMSLLVWLLAKIGRSKQASDDKIIWSAIVIAAIAFGLLHLPSASVFLPITPLVVIAALVLNGIAGIVFGFLYWKRGIESAMLAHFVCNIFLWVISPAFV